MPKRTTVKTGSTQLLPVVFDTTDKRHQRGFIAPDSAPTNGTFELMISKGPNSDPRPIVVTGVTFKRPEHRSRSGMMRTPYATWCVVNATLVDGVHAPTQR